MPHLPVEHVTSREVEGPKVVLVYWNETDVNPPVGGVRGRVSRRETAYTLCVCVCVCVCVHVDVARKVCACVLFVQCE